MPACAAAEVRETWTRTFVTGDPRIGWKLLPNVKAHWERFIGEEKIFSVDVSTDAAGRRTTLQNASPKKEFLLLFGDSYIFGEGLSDQDALGSQFARRLPGVAVYNYALRGYGPNHSYMNTLDRDLAKEVHEKKGTVLFFYADWQLSRLIGASFEAFNQEAPYLALDDSGRVEFRGYFEQARPWFSRFQKWFSSLWFVRKYRLFIPPIRDAHVELLCAVFKGAKANVEKKLPNARFVLVLYPSFTGNIPRPIPCLHDGSLEVVNLYSLLDKEPDEKIFIKKPVEMHHSAYAGGLIADSLKEILWKQGKSAR